MNKKQWKSTIRCWKASGIIEGYRFPLISYEFKSNAIHMILGFAIGILSGLLIGLLMIPGGRLP